MFSQTTEYALRAMAWLALTPDSLVPTQTLAQKTMVPAHYLSKVLQQLAAAGLIVGRRGVRGGYKLGRPARDVSLLDVVRAVGSMDRIRACPLGVREHDANLCPLHRRMDEAAKAVIEIYGSATLHDLASEPRGPGPLCEVGRRTKLTVSA